MNSNAIGIVLIVIGLGLLFFGIQASDSFSSELSRFFQGAPSNKAIWLVIAGALATVAGLVKLTRRRPSEP
jgi:uncharacterized membrane protein YidH (DUF202 family)